MKQLLQNVRNGQLWLADVPAPQATGNRLLVRTEASLISAGTERMVAQLARKGLLGKARARPDLVRKVLTKLRRDGLWQTIESVRRQLDRWMPLGYSAAGRIVGVGPDVTLFQLGRRVACAGAGMANHAEYNLVPELLAAQIPEGVSAEDAAYATVGAIALHGIRNADVRIGEYVVVIGLGLLGQLAARFSFTTARFHPSWPNPRRGHGNRILGCEICSYGCLRGGYRFLPPFTEARSSTVPIPGRQNRLGVFRRH